MGDRLYWTIADLRHDFAALGLRPGDAVMVHAAVSKVGPILGGPDVLIAALQQAIGAEGTILAYADWHVAYDDLLDADGRVPPAWRDAIPPFDPATSRATRDNGIFPEFLRTTPGAQRSGNPGASVVALGGRAEDFVKDHPLDYGYGEGSPFARLVAAGGKVLLLGAPLDTMTLLHHAEHCARIGGKRLRRYEVPIKTPDGVRWRLIEEFDTGDPVLASLAEDYFATIVAGYLATDRGTQGRVGNADCVLVDAAGITTYAVQWLEDYAARNTA